MRPGAWHRPGPRGQKGPCPGPRGLSPKPAGAWRVCPRAPCLATLVTTGASALSSRDPGKRTHDWSKPDSPRAPCTLTSSAQAGTPQRGTGIRARAGGRAVSMEAPAVRPRMEEPRLPAPGGLLVRCLLLWEGSSGGLKAAPHPWRVEEDVHPRGRKSAGRKPGPDPSLGPGPPPARVQAITDRAASRCREDHSLAGAALRPWLCRAPGVWNQHPPGDMVHSHYPQLLPREDQALGPGHSSGQAFPVQTASLRLGPHCTQRACGASPHMPVFNRGGDKPGAGKMEQPQRAWWGVPLPSPGLRALPLLSCS